MTFSERMKQIRTDLDLSQADFARLVGSTPAAISQYESGYRVPAGPTLQAMSKALGISIESLLGEVRGREDADEFKAKILYRNFKKLTPELQKAIKAFMEEGLKRGDKPSEGK